MQKSAFAFYSTIYEPLPKEFILPKGLQVNLSGSKKNPLKHLHRYPAVVVLVNSQSWPQIPHWLHSSSTGTASTQVMLSESSFLFGGQEQT